MELVDQDLTSLIEQKRMTYRNNKDLAFEKQTTVNKHDDVGLRGKILLTVRMFIWLCYTLKSTSLKRRNASF